ncbi:MAG: hypothetical protein HWN80_15140 [Candidatus Lokiarchaeota archaeon]|nr:hypothetical protein [Candidatus Lokiarchaeota archaeon]
MNKNLKPQRNIISQSIKEYQPLFLYRPKDKEYWDKKRKEGLAQFYLKEKGELIPWEGEKILKVFDNVTLNVKDDTFKSKFKKMRVAKRAPNKWKLYFTTERIVATIPYGKTLKIGDIVELFTTTFKRQSHKNYYVIGYFPHSMLAGIVLRLKQGKPTCEHIAFVYKNKLKNRFVNYTLYFFNYGPQKQSEEFCLKFKNLACKLQLKLLKLVKDLSLLSQSELSKIRSKITENLDKKEFETRENREKFNNITIKTLYVGGIPLPIFPRITYKYL